MEKTLALKPRMSEKSYALSKLHNTYVIVVPKEVNKISVKKAVEAQFEVSVTNVRIVIAKGKVKQTVRKGGRAIKGKRSDIKKAYVTLAEGNSLPVFAEAEEK